MENGNKEKQQMLTELEAVIYKYLLENNKRVIFSGVLLAFLMAGGHIYLGLSFKAASVWLPVILLTYVIRYFHTTYSFSQDRTSTRLFNEFRLSIIITSCLWAIAIYFVLVEIEVREERLLFLLGIAGLIGGSTLSYAVDRVCLLGFLLPVMAGIALSSFDQSQSLAIPSITLFTVAFFIVFIISYTRKFANILLQNFQLAIEAQAKQKKEHVHNTVMEMLVKKQPTEKVLEALLIGFEQQHPGISACILLKSENNQEVLHLIGPSISDNFKRTIKHMPTEGTESTPASVVFKEERTIVNNIASDLNFKNDRDLMLNAGFAACWLEPIKNNSGKIIGSFAMYHRTPTIVGEKELALITENALLTNAVVDLINTNQELKLAEMFYQNANDSVIITDSQNKIIAVNDMFTKCTGYKANEVIGRSPDFLKSDKHDDKFYKNITSSLEVNNRWEGEVWRKNRFGQSLPEWLKIRSIYNNEGGLINRISMSTDLTSQKEAEELIWTEANFDQLTDLPNRRLFHEKFLSSLKESRRSQLPLALLFIDIDNFKEVNDTLGHTAGDLLLIETAKRLKKCIREADILGSTAGISRLGGDEFTIIIENLVDAKTVEIVANRILQVISEPYMLSGESVYISTSIGITLYPEDSEDIETLISNADQAMYAAKKLGKNQFSYFTKSMQEEAKNRLALNNDLHKAVLENQLHLYYQPIVDLTDETIYKAEGLIRWQHPEKGIINPVDFIPIAESSGLIVDIGNKVFYDAAEQVKQWRESISDKFQVSINKSPIQFQNKGKSSQNDEHDDWIKHLEENKLPGESISIEITEGLLLEENPVTKSQLLALTKAGIKIALDDFGTGYSSLGYIKQFTVDYIKIDRSFVNNITLSPQDMSLCEVIIIMAHKLNLKVIAEGIETKEQLRLLKAAGCDFGQGYLFSKPLPAKQFEKFCKKYAQ